MSDAMPEDAKSERRHGPLCSLFPASISLIQLRGFPVPSFRELHDTALKIGCYSDVVPCSGFDKGAYRLGN